MKAQIYDFSKHQLINSKSPVRIFPRESKDSLEAIHVGHVYADNGAWYWFHTASNLTSNIGFATKLESVEDLRRVAKEYLNISEIKDDEHT